MVVFFTGLITSNNSLAPPPEASRGAPLRKPKKVARFQIVVLKNVDGFAMIDFPGRRLLRSFGLLLPSQKAYLLVMPISSQLNFILQDLFSGFQIYLFN